MALLWMEGFETYKDTVDVSLDESELQKFWGAAGGGTIQIKTGRTGTGKSIRMGSSGNAGVLRTPIIGSSPEIHFGFGYYVGSLTETHIICIVVDSSGNVKFQLNLIASGNLQVSCPGFGHAISGSTTTTPIAGATWAWIEVSIVFNASGSYSVDVNGSNESEISASGVDTFATGTAVNWGYVEWRSPTPVSADNSARYDDIYICDETGSVNNTLLGDVVIVHTVPTSDVTSDFTPSTGTDNFAVIDEQLPSDSDYVESATDGHIDMYGYNNLALSGDIYGINVRTRARKTAPDDIRLISKSDSGATASDTSAVPVSSETYEHYRIMETDPDTSALWTGSGLDAAEFGFEVEKP